MRAARGGLAAAAVALGLTACGGHTATRRDVIARADAICAGALSQVRALAPPAGASTPAGLEAYVRQAAPVLEREAAALERLPRPAAGRKLLDRYLAAEAALGSSYRALAVAARAGDESGLLQGLVALRDSPAPALAQRYGIGQCAAPGGTGAP